MFHRPRPVFLISLFGFLLITACGGEGDTPSSMALAGDVSTDEAAQDTANNLGSDDGDESQVITEDEGEEEANAQGCDNVFISEYIEGWGNNKAIEVYNPTSAAIDLSDYRLERYSMGLPQQRRIKKFNSAVCCSRMMSWSLSWTNKTLTVLTSSNPFGMSWLRRQTFGFVPFMTSTMRCTSMATMPWFWRAFLTVPTLTFLASLDKIQEKPVGKA